MGNELATPLSDRDESYLKQIEKEVTDLVNDLEGKLKTASEEKTTLQLQLKQATE